MIIVDGECWITAREAAQRWGNAMTLPELQRYGRRTARRGRELGLTPARAPAPPGVPWATEYAWPESLWREIAWDMWLDSQMRHTA